MPKRRTRFLQRFLRRFGIRLTAARRREVLEELETSASPGFDFFLLVVLSCAIATFGLLTDSAAVIIGAMLVAPLMSPILGVSLASVAGQRPMFQRSLIALVEGGLMAIALAAFLSWIGSLLPFGILSELPDEVLARTRPNPFDLGVALAGGAAAAYALAQPRISAALPGVAIATALMPPLCTVGVGIAVADPAVVFGALLLYVTNLTAISFAGIVVFAALGFHPTRLENRWGPIPSSMAISALLVLLTTVPLVGLSLRFVEQGNEMRAIRAVVVQEVTALSEGQLVDLVINDERDVLNLRITVRTSQQPTYQEVVALQTSIATRLQRAVALKLVVVPITELDPFDPPTPTRTPIFTSTSTPSPTRTPTVTRTPTLTPSPTVTPMRARILGTGGQGVYLREAPDGERLVYLPEGTPIVVLEGRWEVGLQTWVEVRDGEGNTGWVLSYFISIQP
ncbi:MAG: DUF389 domain-containing protein [Anaerolineales bacterium]|nr:DUF389 domain-containing protein [Anaerolineales bacterium]